VTERLLIIQPPDDKFRTGQTSRRLRPRPGDPGTHTDVSESCYWRDLREAALKSASVSALTWCSMPSPSISATRSEMPSERGNITTVLCWLLEVIASSRPVFVRKMAREGCEVTTPAFSNRTIVRVDGGTRHTKAARKSWADSVAPFVASLGQVFRPRASGPWRELFRERFCFCDGVSGIETRSEVDG
jgi:hypothetical protein